MWFIAEIIAALSEIRDRCWDAYYETRTWPGLGTYLSRVFLYIGYGFADLIRFFYDFDDWLVFVKGQIANILGWPYIKGIIKGWLYRIEDALSWFYDWWSNVTDVINYWWSLTRYTVQGWIDVAVAPLKEAWEDWLDFWDNTWPQWMTKLDTLKASWDNFWKVTFPTMVSFTWLTTWWNSRLTDILGLIDTAFTRRDSLWVGWQDIKDNVLEFFSDPLEWLWARFTDWFLGPEV